MIVHGDCLEAMAGMEPESVDAVVTDPPYGLGFMGKAWDHGAPGVPFWAEMLRVAKPSSYLLAFGGTRTVHRIATSIEDAGWIIRDMLVWAYASGFPKGKANLKPAWEPVVMARKPGPLRALNIDECRIGTPENKRAAGTRTYAAGKLAGGMDGDGALQLAPHDGLGRWPANVILTDPIFDGGIEGVVGGGEASYNPAGVFGKQRGDQPSDTAAPFAVRKDGDGVFGYGDSGTYSRFFLIPKADRAEREPIAGSLPVREPRHAYGDGLNTATKLVTREQIAAGTVERAGRQNVHPTVKPVDLMRHLVRLVTPPGGTVLDPFLGSGTTGIACEMEGFDWIGIEREAEYVAIAEARLVGVQRGFGLSA